MSLYSIYESLALQVTTKRATYVVNYPCHSMILREDIQKKKKIPVGPVVFIRMERQNKGILLLRNSPENRDINTIVLLNPLAKY